MPNNLLTSDFTAKNAYQHAGVTTTIDDSITAPWGGSPVGLSWGLDGNLYSAVYSSGRVSQHAGFTTTVDDSFLKSGADQRGMSIDQDGNVITVARQVSNTIYLHDGFSSTTLDSINFGTDLHGCTWDGTDLYSCDPWAGGGDLALMRQHDGFSITILDSFPAATGTISRYDISWDGVNLLSQDDDFNKLFQHDGFSSTENIEISSPAGVPYGLSWQNPEGRMGISGVKRLFSNRFNPFNLTFQETA